MPLVDYNQRKPSFGSQREILHRYLTLASSASRTLETHSSLAHGARVVSPTLPTSDCRKRKDVTWHKKPHPVHASRMHQYGT